MKWGLKTGRMPASSAARRSLYGQRGDIGAGPLAGRKTRPGVILTQRYNEDSNDCSEGA